MNRVRCVRPRHVGTAVGLVTTIRGIPHHVRMQHISLPASVMQSVRRTPFFLRVGVVAGVVPVRLAFARVYCVLCAHGVCGACVLFAGVGLSLQLNCGPNHVLAMSSRLE